MKKLKTYFFLIISGLMFISILFLLKPIDINSFENQNVESITKLIYIKDGINLNHSSGQTKKNTYLD